MAELPPVVPNTMSSNTNNWSYLGRHPAPSSSSSSSPLGGAGPMEPPAAAASWADEFFQFSAARRSHSRRAASETAAAFLDDDDAVACASDFGRLDDAQLMSIFSDPIPPPLLSSPSPSSTTPSDQNSVQEDRAPTPAGVEEGQSVYRTQAATDAAPELIVDPRRVRRILANRQSAQRSRVRKLHYIAELEHRVTGLQSEVSALAPRLAFLDQQRSVLIVGNTHLKQRIAALAQDNILKDAQEEALRKELERLRQLYHQQNIDHITTSNPEPVVRNYFNDPTEDNSCM